MGGIYLGAYFLRVYVLLGNFLVNSQGRASPTGNEFQSVSGWSLLPNVNVNEHSLLFSRVNVCFDER
jgi:hypothetical protein